MKLWNQLSQPTKILLYAALALIIYGIACRAFGIYFFWESIYAGSAILMISAILFFLDLIKIKKQQREKGVIIGFRICIGILVFFMLVQSVIITIFPFSDAYEAAKREIMKSKKAKGIVGEVKGFSIAPFGGMRLAKDSSGESGNATLNIIVKGDRYAEMTVYLYLHPDSSAWTVEEIDW